MLNKKLKEINMTTEKNQKTNTYLNIPIDGDLKNRLDEYVAETGYIKKRVVLRAIKELLDREIATA